MTPDRLDPYALSDYLPPAWCAFAQAQAQRREADRERRAVRLLGRLDVSPPHAAALRAGLAWLCALRDDEALPAGLFERLCVAVMGEHRTEDYHHV